MDCWRKERYIESGYVGQVCVGVRANGKTILPPVCEVFPNLLIEAADELKPSESCSSLLQSEPQRLITNRYAALVIAGYINELFSTDTIRNHYTVFNSRDNSSSPSPLPTEEDLEIFKAIQKKQCVTNLRYLYKLLIFVTYKKIDLTILNANINKKIGHILSMIIWVTYLFIQIY